jgi:hypothetical protein
MTVLVSNHLGWLQVAKRVHELKGSLRDELASLARRKAIVVAVMKHRQACSDNLTEPAMRRIAAELDVLCT